VAYLQKRISTKVKITIEVENQNNLDLETILNRPLFEWVIENLCKNAVDAMSGTGQITITIAKVKQNSMLQLDITDTGKGMTAKHAKQIFNAGFTTKRRGWGLGLTLAKRIIENYHNGKIWVLKSELNVGTTFRILIPKK
jgi:signal transduction histidine kinase